MLSYGLARKAAYAVLCAAFIFGLFMINLGYVFPFVVTRITGSQSYIVSEVMKSKGGSRRSISCGYRLKSEDFDRPLFYICVPRKYFYSKPDGSYKAVLHVHRSSFGVHIKIPKYHY